MLSYIYIYIYISERTCEFLLENFNQHQLLVQNKGVEEHPPSILCTH